MKIQFDLHSRPLMGVKQLWKILSPCGKKPVFENKTLAVDTSIWMHYYKSIPDNMITVSVSKRILRMLYSKIRPVFIFDGKPSALKRETIIKRKEDEMKSLIRRIVLNKKCIKCGELLKNCVHINDFDEKEMMKLNREAVQRLKNHKYNWGELSEDSNSNNIVEDSNSNNIVEDSNSNNIVESISTNDQEEKRRKISTAVSKKLNNSTRTSNIIASFDYDSLGGLSKQKQLEKLIDLRSKRGLPMAFDNSDSTSFSKSQIENLKKRNMISMMIRKLNKDSKKIIHSDCTVYTEFHKDQPDIYKSFYYKEEDIKEQPEEDQESSDINNLFDKHEHDEWEDIFEKYEQKQFEMDESMVLKHTQYNTEIMKTVGNDERIPTRKRRLVPDTSLMKQPVLSGEDENNATLDTINTSSDSIDASSDIPDFLLESTSSESDAISQPTAKMNPAQLETLNNDLQRVQKLIIELLNVLELPYIESIGETDSQCGYLSRNKLIDGVITEDNDMVIQKGVVYKNFFRKDKDVVSYSYEDVVSELGLDQDALVKIGYLLGSDYCIGVKGVGIKSVLSKLDTVSSEDIRPYKEIYNDDNVRKVDDIKFGSLNMGKFKSYLLIKGIEISKIDELMLCCKKIIEG